MRARAGKKAPSITARREYDHVRAEPMNGAVIQIPCYHAATCTLIVHYEIEREVLDKKLRLVFQRLLVQRMQDCMSGAVCRSACARYRRLAEIAHVASERTLVNATVWIARERHTEVFQ